MGMALSCQHDEYTDDIPTLPSGGRWMADQRFICDGIEFRVVTGKKKPGDLRLEAYHQDKGWVPVGMRLAAMLTDFFWENEEVLYPPPKYQGGKYFLRFLGHATRNGWRAAVDELERQKSRRRNRESEL